MELDLGESSAIALAIEKEESLLIIDERKGRFIAKQMKIPTIGILGVIIKAKEIGEINSVCSFIQRLEKVGFRISKNLKDQILSKVNELSEISI